MYPRNSKLPLIFALVDAALKYVLHSALQSGLFIIHLPDQHFVLLLVIGSSLVNRIIL